MLLKKGSKGDNVKILQEFLGITADGKQIMDYYPMVS